MQESWSHWTRYGVFELKREFSARSYYYDLYFRGVYLARYVHPATAIQEIYDGKFDKEIGAKGSEIGLPERASDWNNLN